MNFAVIKTGGKQYKVSEGDVLLVEKLDVETGNDVTFEQVLLTGNGSPDSMKLGTPLVDGASVTAKIVEHGRDKKKIVFKYSNKTRYKKKKGHKQPNTKIEILKINS